MYSYHYHPYQMYYPVRQEVTRAFAQIRGSELAPNLHGYVTFMEVPYGTEVTVEVAGLPAYQPAQGDQDPIGPHGFHIHKHANCTVGDESDPFQAAGGHWNPDNQPHGNHAGDFPVLFSNDGYARMTFFTNRFRPQDVVGRSVMIHQNPDDYRSQPSGDSGKRIGCGPIKAF
ncbi:superoxide dismutase family protein [Virgibacillus alimentarius]|uniref:superoxide dismutase family protein n=1 Tax=Virgibacillus alimentarius TaxID=698769 RepID=UPI0004931F33|nr:MULTISPECIES: superoxide dismutase family protein [Virgibacillus]HLR68208.1 superoxide dismutase family protein [Virgibacillus sp.]